MIEFTDKQKLLLSYRTGIDTIVFGGARGGGKTFGVSGLKMCLDVVEDYSSKEMDKYNLDKTKYRVYMNPENNNVRYYKILIDYPEYRGCIVRRTESSLIASTKVECDKVYKQYGARFTGGSKNRYRFPSGAEIWLRPVKRKEDLDFFQGMNFQRLAIEELTQFHEWEVEEMESACRSSHPFISKMRVYTTNPGKIGHAWVKKKYIDVCRPKADGEKKYVKEIDLEYQPLKPNRIHVTKEGERFLFIPSLVFDNPYLAENDISYIKNLMNKNEILKRMWLYGDWDVFAGQFFDMWDESYHVKDEYEFFGALDKPDLIKKRKTFDWTDYRLFRSFDYGYGAPWACGAYAVNNHTGDITKFTEIVEKGLTAVMQARRVNEFFSEVYGLTNDDFELNVADPKSFWQNMDRGDGFRTAKDDYEDEGIILTEGINLREQGAMAVLEALRIREEVGTPRLTFLDNCIYNVETFPNLPADERNPNDVDTKAEDHAYDETKYFLLKVIGEYIDKNPTVNKKKSWRDKLNDTPRSGVSSWKVA